MRLMRRFEMIVLALFLLSLLMAAYFYPALPDQVVTHWDMSGSPNGYMPRVWGAFLMPLVTAAIAIIFLAIPRIDPLKANIRKFMGQYERFVIVILLFMVAVQLHGLLWNTGTQISPNAAVPAGIGVLFYFVGDLCESSKRNWFIGIRTPWTMSSDRVWERTNRLGGKLYKACAAIALLGALFPEMLIVAIVAPVIAVSLFLIAYSYFEYGKERG
jgi:uncharacterized membrane protein